jgi:hypothetical protein
MDGAVILMQVLVPRAILVVLVVMLLDPSRDMLLHTMFIIYSGLLTGVTVMVDGGTLAGLTLMVCLLGVLGLILIPVGSLLKLGPSMLM